MACESNYKFNSEKSSLYSYLTYGMFKQYHGYILNLPPAGRRPPREPRRKRNDSSGRIPSASDEIPR